MRHVLRAFSAVPRLYNSPSSTYNTHALKVFQRLSFSIEALLHTYYDNNMCTQASEDSAEHTIALLSVDPKGNQSHSRSIGGVVKVLLCTLFSLMLALSLGLCVVYRHQYGQHNVQNTHVEEHFVDQPRGSDGRVPVKQHRNIDAVASPGNIEVSSSQTRVSTPTTAILNEISKKARRRSHIPSRAKMNSFVKVLEDLLHEDLLQIHQKILCLDVHADKEVVALRERGFKDAQGINWLPALLNPKHTHGFTQRKKLTSQNFDFFFTSMFDRIPNQALFVAEIERTLKVGGLAAMHVSLNKWRNKYITSASGRGIKPVTLLFQHSEIVYVSSVHAPGLDTIIVFKKTTDAEAKQADQMEIKKKALHGNLSIPQSIVNQVELSTKPKCRKHAGERQLKILRYTAKLQRTGSLLYTSGHSTVLPTSVAHFRGEVVMKSTPTGLPGASNSDTLNVQDSSNVAQLNRATVQDGISASGMHAEAFFSDGQQAGVENKMTADS